MTKTNTTRKLNEEEQKKLQLLQDRFKTVFDNASNGIILTKNRIVQETNEAFRKMTGYTAEEAIGKHFTELIHSESKRLVEEYSQRRNKGDTTVPDTYTITAQTKNKEKRYWLLTVSRPHRDGSKSVIIRDVTHRIKLEQAVQQRNKMLLNLQKTSNLLQETTEIDSIIDIAIKTFLELDFDRVRVYLLDRQKNLFVGKRASYKTHAPFETIGHPLDPSYKNSYRCVVEKRPVIINNKDFTYVSELGKEDLEETAALPLICYGNVIGIISVDNKFSKRKLVQEELDVLASFTNNIAIAIANSELYIKNLKRVQTLSTLYDVGKMIASTVDLEKILNLIIAKIIKTTHASQCTIQMLEANGKTLQTAAAYGKTKKQSGLESKYITEALDSKKQIHITNIASEKSREWEWAKKERLQSLLIIPLILEGVPIGVITIHSRRTTALTEGHLGLLNGLSDQAATAIANHRLYEQIRVDREKLTHLLTISHDINSTLNINTLLTSVLEKTIAFTNADYGGLFLVKDDKLETFLERGGYSGKEIKAPQVAITTGIVGEVVRSGKLIQVGDVHEREGYYELFKETRSEAAIPLIRHGKVIGVLNLESKKKDNFRKLKRPLEVLTNMIAIAIENAELYDETKTFNKRLKDEIARATVELRKKNVELRKMDQLKSEFVSNVSHELRTPLTSISGYTKLLRSQKPGDINDKQNQCLTIIEEESMRLTSLINDILDLSKLESGKVRYKVAFVNIDDLITSTIDEMKLVAAKKEISISHIPLEDACEVKASYDLIKQVLINLLSNAIKFSRRGGHVRIFCEVEDGELRVSVQDNGRGISKDHIPKLFDKFHQVDGSMTREQGGTGLGLPIVKHIVTSHKGKIMVKSQINKGSTFSFTLPLSTRKEHVIHSEASK